MHMGFRYVHYIEKPRVMVRGPVTTFVVNRGRHWPKNVLENGAGALCMTMVLTQNAAAIRGHD